MGGHSGYATDSETEFLKRLGSYSEPSKRLDRLDLLKGYLHSIPSRVEWGGIDRLRVQQEVIALIEREVILGG